MLENTLIGLKPYLKTTMKKKDYVRFAWLYDHIASQLGQPPASSYNVELLEDDVE